MRGSMDCAVLSEQPGRKAKLTVDPSGSRVLVELADYGMHALYLRHGHLVIQRKLESLVGGTPSTLLQADGTVNWSRIPPFLAVLDETQLIPPHRARARRLGERDHRRQGRPQGLAGGADDLCRHHRQGVHPRGGKARRRRSRRPAQAAAARGDRGQRGRADWFDAHPEEQDADFVEALKDSVENSNFDIGTGLTRLLRLDPRRAEELACDDPPNEGGTRAPRLRTTTRVSPCRSAP